MTATLLKRRAASTSTARRPDIAATMVRVVAAAKAACVFADTQLSEPVALAAVIETFARRPATDSAPDVETADIANCEVLCGALWRAFEAAAPAHSLDETAFVTVVREAWLAATPKEGAGLAVLAAELTASGVDAVSLSEALIHHESGRHLKLVWFQANRLADIYQDYSPEDLFGWGWTGLIGALRRYNPEVSSFSTYAVIRITGAIRDGVRAESWVPKRLGTYARKVAACEEKVSQDLGRPANTAEVADAVAANHLAAELGRPPALCEIADRVESDRARFAMLPRLERPVSVEEMGDPDAIPDTPWGHPVCDPETETLLGALRSDLHTALRDMDPGVAQAVQLVDLEGVPVHEAARRLGVPPRTLRSHRNLGWAVLRDRLAAWA